MSNPSKFKAFMFDFDGTITDKGVSVPQQDMVDTLVELAQNTPIACCTGRQMESFVRHGLNYFLDGISEDRRLGLLKNLHLIAENGSIGYFYDLEEDCFKEFYQTPWPKDFVDRDFFMDALAEKINDNGKVYFDRHRVVVVVAPVISSHSGDANVEDVYKASQLLYDMIIDKLEFISRAKGVHFSEFLHVGNSGIGVVVIPADGDKDNGIKMFADYLRKNRGMILDKKASEILLVGDRPQVGGNDHYFLNGNYGTAFSVGALCDDADSPVPVLDDNGNRIFHADGTMFLIRKEFLC